MTICSAKGYPVSVAVGSNSLKGQATFYPVIKMHYHPQFSAQYAQNDIGLLRLGRSIAFNSKVQPVKLPPSMFYQSANSAVFTGWGDVSVSLITFKNTLITLRNFKRISFNLASK